MQMSLALPAFGLHAFLSAVYLAEISVLAAFYSALGIGAAMALAPKARQMTAASAE